MRFLFEYLFGGDLERETQRYLKEIELGPVTAARTRIAELLQKLAEKGSPIEVGSTSFGQSVALPTEEIMDACGIVTGARGSGKTRVALIMIKALLGALAEALLKQKPKPRGFGVLDAKSELFHGVVYVLLQFIEELQCTHPQLADEIRRRVVIIDFSSRDPIIAYNILVRWPNAEADFFAASRADLLMDLLPGRDKLSLGGTGMLKKLILLLSEFNLPITKAEDVVSDESLRSKLLARCRNRSVVAYFARQFPKAPKSTVTAILRRIESLFNCEGVRLALAGTSAPDFRRLQDDGYLVFINTFGETIARSIRYLLLSLVLSDITHSVFARRCRDRSFLWFCDEAQHLFSTGELRDNITDLVTMSRSFGSGFVFFTQNISTAVQDARIMKILATNTRWSLSLRGEPAEFLKAALPVTGRRRRPQTHPFTEESFYSTAEERGIVFDEVASLPDRVGYLWLKGWSVEAILIKTAELTMPHGKDLDEATAPIRHDPSIGQRAARNTYQQLIAEREKEWTDKTSGELGIMFREEYRRRRGETKS